MDEFFRRSEFADYDGIRVLSQKGGFGDIFIGHKIGLDVQVVIKRTKQIRFSVINQEQEANILKNLKHQYLPRIYDMIVSGDGFVYTIIDFSPGEDLQRYVKDHGPIDEKRAMRWAKQLCEVVQYLHHQKPPIIHCDIKPANVMITPDDNICLIDFNTSTLLGTMGVRAVTNGYAAPEQYVRPGDHMGSASPKEQVPAPKLNVFANLAMDQKAVAERTEQYDKTVTLFAEPLMEEAKAKGEQKRGAELPLRSSSVSSGVTDRADRFREISPRTDIYAIGATLYYMVTGIRPEKALDEVTALSRRNPAVSASFVRVIERAMQKDPEKRFPDAVQMLHALDDVTEIDTGLKRLKRTHLVTILILIILWAAGGSMFAFGIVSLQRESDSTYLSYLADGDNALENGDYAAAEDAYEKAVEVKPELLQGYLQTAYLYYYRGQYQLAIDTLESIQTSDVIQTKFLSGEDLAAIHYVEGTCYFEMRDYENAIAEEKEALTTDADNTGALLRLAMAQAGSGDTDQARETINELESAGGDEAQCSVILAEIEGKEGNGTAAHEAYQKAIDATDDTDILYHAYLGEAKLYEEEENYDNEIALLEEACGRLPNSTSLVIRQQLAQAYSSLAAKEMDQSENSDKVKEYYGKAVDLYEEMVSDGTQSLVSMLNLAAANEGLGDVRGALNALTQAEDLYPYDYRVDMRLSYLYATHHGEIGKDSEDFAKSAEWYKSALEKYQQKLANGGSEDTNMINLKNLMHQLKDAKLIKN